MTGFGLFIMWERAAEIGGKIDIESAAEKGSRIVLYVPHKQEEGRSEYETHAG